VPFKSKPKYTLLKSMGVVRKTRGTRTGTPSDFLVLIGLERHAEVPQGGRKVKSCYLREGTAWARTSELPACAHGRHELG
jgi:hypothetical protein